MNATVVLPCRRRQRQILLALGLVLLGFVPGCSREQLSHYQRKQLAEKEAVEYLQALGGKVSQKNYPRVSKKGQVATKVVVLAGVQTIDDGVFNRLKQVDSVTELDLSKTNTTDAHLEHINGEIGSTLIILNLSHTAVTDQGLAKLTQLPMLTTLILTGTKTTPANDEPLRQRLSAQRGAATPLIPDLPKQRTIQR